MRPFVLPLVVLPWLLATGCATAPERAWYAPLGADFGREIATHREESDDAILELRCQGAYENEVDGVPTLTVHVTLEVARPRSGPLQFPREGWSAHLSGMADGGSITLPLGEAWSGREPLSGPLVVPSWSRRPFDLFFDAPRLDARALPSRVRVAWSAHAPGGGPLVGQVAFARIAPDDPRCPGEALVDDTAFGLRDGYYLPGRVRLGARALRPSFEERLHYVFHAPRRWLLWPPW